MLLDAWGMEAAFIFGAPPFLMPTAFWGLPAAPMVGWCCGGCGSWLTDYSCFWLSLWFWGRFWLLDWRVPGCPLSFWELACLLDNVIWGWLLVGTEPRADWTFGVLGNANDVPIAVIGYWIWRFWPARAPPRMLPSAASAASPSRLVSSELWL